MHNRKQSQNASLGGCTPPARAESQPWCPHLCSGAPGEPGVGTCASTTHRAPELPSAGLAVPANPAQTLGVRSFLSLTGHRRLDKCARVGEGALCALWGAERHPRPPPTRHQQRPSINNHKLPQTPPRVPWGQDRRERPTALLTLSKNTLKYKTKTSHTCVAQA